jgi:glycosyltransferase involved in cell wall biosynthesis
LLNASFHLVRTLQPFRTDIWQYSVVVEAFLAYDLRSSNMSTAACFDPQSGRTVQVSVVIPCLNEAETLANCVRKAFEALQTAKLPGEVIVADNGSSDQSRSIALREGARVIDVPVKGYGAALSAGIGAASGEVILIADADGSYDFSHLPRFLSALDDGAELVVGNRFAGGIQTGAMPFLHRYLGNPVLSLLGRLFFHAPVHDFHCGIRAFTKASINRLQLSAVGMEFASEMVVKASMMGLDIREVPTTLSPDGRTRAPHLRTWRDGWRHLRFLLLHSPRWLFLYPGLLLTIFGLLGAAWLIPAPRTIGRVTLDVDTLAYCLGSVLVGSQICVFAVSGKAIGIRLGLLPEDRTFTNRLDRISLETGVFAGILLLCLGLLATAYGVSSWYRTGFGNLDPIRTLRITLPAVTAILLGVETIFASFFLGLLRQPGVSRPAG